MLNDASVLLQHAHAVVALPPMLKKIRASEGWSYCSATQLMRHLITRYASHNTGICNGRADMFLQQLWPLNKGCSHQEQHSDASACKIVKLAGKPKLQMLLRRDKIVLARHSILPVLASNMGKMMQA